MSCYKLQSVGTLEVLQRVRFPRYDDSTSYTGVPPRTSFQLGARTHLGARMWPGTSLYTGYAK